MLQLARYTLCGIFHCFKPAAGLPQFAFDRPKVFALVEWGLVLAAKTPAQSGLDRLPQPSKLATNRESFEFLTLLVKRRDILLEPSSEQLLAFPNHADGMHGQVKLEFSPDVVF
jgi:hypothetical protein